MYTNRRNFLKTAGLAAAAFPSIIPARALGQNAPSKQITLGCIGMGGQGMKYNMQPFMTHDDCRVVAVCDVFLSRAKRAQGIVHEAYQNKDCKAYQDFREILVDPSIDAVCISTPDHWHVPMALMALDAGKHVFCEKPTQSIYEGGQLVEAFAKSDRVFQAGIEDRSAAHFHKMVEWVKNGAIGQLERVDVVMPKGNDVAKDEPAAVPEDLDWNLWQGPAEYHEYSPQRTRGMSWRQIGIYSKGTILDIGTHLVDTAQLGVNDPDGCPVEVSGSGYIPAGRLTDVPTEYDLNYRYGNGVEMNVRNGEGVVWDPKSCVLKFTGSQGWIQRDGFYSGLEASDPQILRIRYSAEETRHWPLPPREHRNFLDAIQSGKTPVYPPEDLHQMCTTLFMGVHCIELGRKLKWNPAKEEYKGDQEANQLRFTPPARDWANA
ncbi:MAG: Gfo/Idh/MocA family oxidoreductase [Verrucomicrobiota bacterium]